MMNNVSNLGVCINSTIGNGKYKTLKLKCIGVSLESGATFLNRKLQFSTSMTLAMFRGVLKGLVPAHFIAETRIMVSLWSDAGTFQQWRY